MVFSALHPEVDEIAGMGYDSSEPVPQGMLRESLDFLGREGLGKPLHIVFHEDLDGRTADADATIDGSGDASDRRNMGAKQGEEIGRRRGVDHRDKWNGGE
jgi:hypothetical protein